MTATSQIAQAQQDIARYAALFEGLSELAAAAGIENQHVHDSILHVAQIVESPTIPTLANTIETVAAQKGPQLAASVFALATAVFPKLLPGFQLVPTSEQQAKVAAAPPRVAKVAAASSPSPTSAASSGAASAPVSALSGDHPFWIADHNTTSGVEASVTPVSASADVSAAGAIGDASASSGPSYGDRTHDPAVLLAAPPAATSEASAADEPPVPEPPMDAPEQEQV